MTVTPQATPTFKENASEIVIETAEYQITITRFGFGLSLRRGEDIILESAQPDDAIANLSFECNGTAQHLTQLRSFAHTLEKVILEYETSCEGAEARVELVLAGDRVGVSTWLLHKDIHLTPILRYRLAPSGFWYGGGFQGWRFPQVFHLNKARINQAAFLASSATQATPVWYATNGVALWVRTPHDFRYSINDRVDGKEDGLLCIEMPLASSISYDIIIGGNIRDVVQRIIQEIGYPRTTPPAEYFKLPIYTTWVEYKTTVSQTKVIEFADNIRDRDLPCGAIEIDDKWEENYGDMNFDSAKFPDPKAMVDELHEKGYRAILWVHPFVNLEAKTFAETKTNRLLMRDRSGNIGLIKWWQGIATVWDFTNPNAAAEFRDRLHRLQQLYGFDGFKFDGGDINLVPRDLCAAQNITPAQYADIYNRETTAHFTWNETRVGIYSQPLGIVQRLIDKHSVWGLENGLAAIIPEAIAVSMRGFPYLMPDMVGGNEYYGDAIDKELLIRWAQASALMPLLQFSKGPWHFDDEAVQRSREACLLHLKFAPYIYQLAQAAPETGEPILAPLWYRAPDDRDAYEITDQFMLGTDVVVAPVLVKGAITRDLYLPEGRWIDYKTGAAIAGKRWLQDYPAPLDTLPLFVREGSAFSISAV